MLNRTAFESTYRVAQTLRPWLPQKLRGKVMAEKPAGTIPQNARPRKMIMLEGCVQPGMSPNINAATLRVLDKLGIQLQRPQNAGCCGAINLHMGAESLAQPVHQRGNVRIRAPRDGVVAEILVGDAQPVEFGEPLVLLEA